LCDRDQPDAREICCQMSSLLSMFLGYFQVEAEKGAPTVI
jgi:hypothetical protein